MVKLFVVEMWDTSIEISIRAGVYADILDEAEEAALANGKHSVKVTAIEEVDGYVIQLVNANLPK